MDPLRINKPIPLEQPVNELGRKLKEASVDFERLFARQLVEEMTKDSFKTADNTYGSSTSHLYRGKVVESLSDALAESGSLGLGDMLHKHWIKQIIDSNE
jgi:Rod binding domain-containing protein